MSCRTCPLIHVPDMFPRPCVGHVPSSMCRTYSLVHAVPGMFPLPCRAGHVPSSMSCRAAVPVPFGQRRKLALFAHAAAYKNCWRGHRARSAAGINCAPHAVLADPGDAYKLQLVTVHRVAVVHSFLCWAVRVQHTLMVGVCTANHGGELSVYSTPWC